MKRLLTSLVVAAFACVGLVIGAMPAAAVERVSTQCDYISVWIDERTSPGVVTVEIDGEVVDSAPLELDAPPNRPQYTWEDGLDWDVAHEWTVTIDSEDDADDWSDSGTTTPCDESPWAGARAGDTCSSVGVYVWFYPVAGTVQIVVDGEVALEDDLQLGVGGELPDPELYGFEESVDVDPTVAHDWTVIVDAEDDTYDFERSDTTEPCTPGDGPTDVVIDDRCDLLTVDVTSAESGMLSVTIDGESVGGGDFDQAWSESYELDPVTSHEWVVIVRPDSEVTGWAWSGTTEPCEDDGGDPAGPGEGAGPGDGGTPPVDDGAPQLPETGPDATAAGLAALLIVGGGTLAWLGHRRLGAHR